MPVQRIDRFALTVAFIVWAAAVPAAQDVANTGTVRVLAAERGTEKPIRFANMIAVGAHFGSLVDTVGLAIVTGLPPGSWIVRAQVIRGDFQIDTATVVAGETTSVSIAVGPLTAVASDCVLDIRPARPRAWAAVGPSICAWRVGSSRPPGRGDVPFDERVPGMREPANWNSVPGPGSLSAVVRSLRSHHPSVLVEDAATGASRLLLKPWASQPLWSPDGRWIACNVFGSPEAPYNLALVEVPSGRVHLPDLDAQIAEYRWSPDSRHLALEVTSAQGGLTVLGIYSLATGAFTPLDTLALLAEYQFSWSPDARTLAVSKPTWTDREHEDEVTQADIWLIDISGARCRLVEGKDFIAGQPRWIDSTHVCYEKEVWKPVDSEVTERVVVTLARSR